MQTKDGETAEAKTAPDIVYHYTTGVNLRGILDKGQIDPSPRTADSDCPAVWFTRSPEWEPTANKMIRTTNRKRYFLDTKHTELGYGGLYRIVVAGHSAPMSWLAFKCHSGMSLEAALVYEKESMDLGASPMDYFASLMPVLKTNWLGIDSWNGSAWETWDGTEKPANDQHALDQFIASGGNPI